MSSAHLVGLRRNDRGPRFALVSPATSILSCYGNYVRALSAHGDVVGIAPCDGVAETPSLSASAFARECLSVLLADDPRRPTYVLGWKTGADLARHIAGQGALAHCALGLVALDPSFDFDSHSIFREAGAEARHADKAAWKYFAINLCGKEIGEGLIEDEGFRAFNTDHAKAKYLYQWRATKHDRPSLRTPYELPEEQFVFFKRLMFETYGTQFPLEVHGSMLVVARSSDQARAKELLAPIIATTKELIDSGEDRLSPLSAKTAGVVVEALGFRRKE